ncbi:MAG: FTR1 family protein [Bdellovibrionales bacterium]
MLAAALIVFREVLEAALVITVVMAATRGLRHRNRWVGVGIAGGIGCAAIVAALASSIADAFEGRGQEIVNAAILFTAVALIGWHVIWMNSHGRKMAAELRAAAQSVRAGEKHMSLLALIVGLAVMREGAEVVLMLQGLWAGQERAAMLTGSALGMLAGVAVGGLLYFGLLKLSVAKLFAFTNWLLILIAAGMAAKGANFLVQADLLPPLGDSLWDTSFILSDDSMLGQMASALVGYIARPSGIQVAFYAATVLSVSLLVRITHHLHFGTRKAAS